MLASYKLLIRDLQEKDYWDMTIAIVVVFSIGVGLNLDGFVSHPLQLILGVCCWIILIALLFGEEKDVRLQVAVAIVFATIGEYIASPFLGAYIYRLENVPGYASPGHGMAYLTAVALGRSTFFHRHRQLVMGFTLSIGTLWSLWGSVLAERGDTAGALLFCVFFIFVLKGRAPLLYVGAFYITSFLELVGTYAGTWAWAVYEPTLGLSQANPPSGIAAWYCLIDAVALTGAPWLARVIQGFLQWTSRHNLSERLCLRKFILIFSGGFPSLHGLFSLDSPAVSAEDASTPNDSMTGNQKGDGVSADGVCNRAGCRRMVNGSSDLPVR